jgi:two-component system, LuxR family, response regulator FixJ
VIVMASDADVPIAVRAMALGALDFIEKPFVDRALISRVKQALHLAA